MIQVTINATSEQAQARYRRDRAGVALVVRRDPEGPYLSEIGLGALTPVSGDDPAELMAAGDYFADMDSKDTVVAQRLWDLAVQYWTVPLGQPATL